MSLSVTIPIGISFLSFVLPETFSRLEPLLSFKITILHILSSYINLDACFIVRFSGIVTTFRVTEDNDGVSHPGSLRYYRDRDGFYVLNELNIADGR